MRIITARQVIQDAYSEGQRSGDPFAPRVDCSPKDNDMKIVSLMEAGKVLAIIGKMKPHQQDIASFLYGVEESDDRDGRVYRYVQGQYNLRFNGTELYKSTLSTKRYNRLIWFALSNVRNLEWNGQSLFTDADIYQALDMDRKNYERRWRTAYIALQGIIHDQVPKILGPVAEWVDKAREGERAA